MPDPLYPVDRILLLLPESPQRIEKATSGLSAEQLQAPAGEGEWSARDVMAHLRACSDVWGGHIHRILTEDQPNIAGINPRVYIKKTNYPEQTFEKLFVDFVRQRADLLSVLKNLPPEGWVRSALVRSYGQVFEKRVQFYADKMARHERGHVNQIQKIASLMHKSSR